MLDTTFYFPKNQARWYTGTIYLIIQYNKSDEENALFKLKSVLHGRKHKELRRFPSPNGSCN